MKTFALEFFKPIPAPKIFSPRCPLAASLPSIFICLNPPTRPPKKVVRLFKLMSSTVEPIEIVVLSLVRSTERRLAAARQLETAGLPWSFVAAVDAATFPPFPPEFDQQQHIRYYGCPIPIGQIGCFLSHRLAWEKCVQTGRLTLVFEDDFQLLQELSDIIALAQQHAKDFDILRLQGMETDCPNTVVQACENSQLVRHHRDPLGATAYFVKPSAAKILLEKSRRFHAPVDDFIFHDWIHGLTLLALLPYPVTPGGQPSTITHHHGETLSRRQKWQVRVQRLPRSACKRIFYSQLALTRFWQKLFPNKGG